MWQKYIKYVITSAPFLAFELSFVILHSLMYIFLLYTEKKNTLMPSHT